MKNCTDIEHKLIDFIEGNLPEKEKKSVENHIEYCENCNDEFVKTKILFGKMDNVLEEMPSEKLRLNFNDFLAEEKLKHDNVIALNSEIKLKPYLQAVASVALIISAFLLGRFELKSEKEFAQKDIQKQEKILAMLGNNQSASKRIQAIDLSAEMPENTKIIDALISRLYNDKNTNVRLEVVGALAKFSNLESVRNALIKALETDEDPIVQIELIKILTKIQEKRALKPMKKLLKEKETENYVKQELQYHIASLL